MDTHKLLAQLFESQMVANAPSKTRHQWTAADDKLLGTKSDRMVAIELGTTSYGTTSRTSPSR